MFTETTDRDKLTAVRALIDGLDEKISAAIEQRAELSYIASKWRGEKTRDVDRESEIRDAARRRARNITQEDASLIFAVIIDACVRAWETK